MTDKLREPPTIELSGVQLRRLRMADTAALCNYMRDPAVTELTSYPVVTVPMVEAMIERPLSRWAAGEFSKWGVALQLNAKLLASRQPPERANFPGCAHSVPAAILSQLTPVEMARSPLPG